MFSCVKQDGRALQFVKDQTFEVCMEAVKQNPFAIEHIYNQEMKERVAEANGESYEY